MSAPVLVGSSPQHEAALPCEHFPPLRQYRGPKGSASGRSWPVQWTLPRHWALPFSPRSCSPVAVWGSGCTPALQPRLSLLLGLSLC